MLAGKWNDLLFPYVFVCMCVCVYRFVCVYLACGAVEAFQNGASFVNQSECWGSVL